MLRIDEAIVYQLTSRQVSENRQNTTRVPRSYRINKAQKTGENPGLMRIFLGCASNLLTGVWAKPDRPGRSV